MESNEGLILQLNKELSIELSAKMAADELKTRLISYINHLIQNHFEQLVSLLYRIDISEEKIKSLLQQQSGEDAAKIISALIIERQLKKIETRRQHRQQNDNFSSEEKW